MSFFRANLIGLKADRDKKEIGILVFVTHVHTNEYIITYTVGMY